MDTLKMWLKWKAIHLDVPSDLTSGQEQTEQLASLTVVHRGPVHNRDV